MPLTTALWSDEEEWNQVGSDLDLSDEDELASTHEGENRSADVDSRVVDEDHVDGVLGDEDSDAFHEEDEEEKEYILSPELQSIKGTTNCRQAQSTRYR
jgi:hypothetical protein